MDPAITDRGTHIEISIALPALCGDGFLDVLARATNRFGRKPILVLCDDLRSEMRLEDAYRVGVGMAGLFPGQAVAVVLRGRRASEVEYFTELVAANRGARVRYFQDAASALSWLRASLR